jgi:hypothetical protein
MLQEIILMVEKYLENENEKHHPVPCLIVVGPLGFEPETNGDITRNPKL